MSRTDPAKRLEEKRKQKVSRHESELAGTRGRKPHKAKATSSNRFKGGKLAR